MASKKLSKPTFGINTRKMGSFRTSMCHFLGCCLILSGFDLLAVTSALRIGPEKTMPQIRIKQWQEVGEFDWSEPRATDGALNSDLLSVVNGSVFVFTQEVQSAIISCEAPYPIEWTTDFGFRFPPSALYLMRGRSVRTSGDIFDEASFGYANELLIRGQMRDFTGNYTCQKVGDSNFAQSSYVFWEGLPPPFLILAGQTQKLEITGQESTVTLPCYTSVPDAELYLFKSLPNMFHVEDYQPLSFNDSIRFDSKKGVIIDAKVMPFPLGKYKCATNDSNDFVLVEVVRSLTGPPKKSENPDLISKGSSLSYDEVKKTLTCCSPGSTAPSISFQFCMDPTVCKFMEDFRPDDSATNGTKKKIPTHPFMRSIGQVNGSCISSPLYPGIVGHFQCNGEGINVIRTLYTSFESPANHSFSLYTSWDGIKPDEFVAITVNEVDFFSRFYDMRGGRLRGGRGGRGGRRRQGNTDKNGKPTDQGQKGKGKGGSWRKKLGANYRYLWRPKPIHGGKMPAHIYAGELLNFTCKGSINYFAFGSRFAIRFKNHTIVQLQSDEMDPSMARQVLSFQRFTTSKVSLIEMTTEMEAIVCYSPVFNSSKWIQKELKLNVESPKMPEIVSGPDEILYWTLNDTNQELTCAAKGEPRPSVMFLIDGKEITNSSWAVVQTANSSLTIKIPLVSHETHGEYTCVASNLAGSVEQKIKLIVEDPTHWASVIVITIVSILLVMALLLLGWKFQIQRKIVQKLRRNPILQDSD